MIVMTSQKIRTHGVYVKRSGFLEWCQYYHAVHREYRVLGFPVYWKRLAKCDRPMRMLIKQACGA